MPIESHAEVGASEARRQFHDEQCAAYELGMRMPLHIGLSILAVVGTPFLLLVPAFSTITGMTFEAALPLGLMVVPFMLLATFVYRRVGFRSGWFRVFDNLETFAIQLCIGLLIGIAGKADSAFWFFYLAHALVVAMHPAGRPESILLVLAMPLFLTGWFLFDEGLGAGAVFSLIGFAMGLMITSFCRGLQKRLSNLAFERAELARNLSLLQVENERIRIARDLHDGMTADLTAIAWKADTLAHEAEGERLPQELRAIGMRARAAIDDTRSVISALQGDEISWKRLAEHLESRARDLCGDRVSLSLELATREGVVAGDTAVDVLRIVQEAVRNALQHSGASHVSVAMSFDNGVILEINDDGQGMHGAASGARGGLANLEARTRSHGGKMNVLPLSPGTRVSIELPL